MNPPPGSTGRRAKRARRVRAVSPLLLGAMLAACGGPPPSAPQPEDGAAAWSIAHADVLFTARRGPTLDLWKLDLATGDTARVTDFGESGASANAARVSPDGTQIVFQVIRDSNYDLYRRPLDGGDAIRLTDDATFEVNPVWSPDGQSIAFMSTRGFEPGSIGPFPGHVYIMPSGGGEPRAVTTTPLTSSFGPNDWSPDGRNLLIARGADNDRPDVFLLDVQTGAETQLTSSPAGEYAAVFSHDGKRVAFHAETASTAQIEIMNLDGSDRRALTSGPGLRYYPQWSPDDRWILFTASNDGKQFDIRAVSVDDGTTIDLVATPEDEREGAWLFPTP